MTPTERAQLAWKVIMEITPDDPVDELHVISHFIEAAEADAWRRAIEAAGAAVYSELRVRGASEELAGKIRDAVRALEPKP